MLYRVYAIWSRVLQDACMYAPFGSFALLQSNETTHLTSAVEYLSLHLQLTKH